jgi:hypothetical protein
MVIIYITVNITTGEHMLHYETTIHDDITSAQTHLNLPYRVVTEPTDIIEQSITDILTIINNGYLYAKY